MNTMDSRRFNSLMPRLNEEWAANVLNMSRNKGNGPDLIDDEKIVEVKFTLYPNKKDYKKWNILEHQMHYPENTEKIGFWGAGIYSLSKPISEIRGISLSELEKLVISRTIQIIPWEWAEQFSPHETRGKTEKTQWEWTFRYTKGKFLPKVVEELSVDGGIIYFSEGVNPELFKKQYNQIKEENNYPF